MSQEWIEKLIPILASTFGVGLIRSLAFGFLRKAVRQAVKIGIGLFIIFLCGWLFYHYW